MTNISKKKLILLDDATVEQLQILAKHAGLDEYKTEWVLNFVYGDDLSPENVARARKYLKKFYTFVDITDPNFTTGC